MQGEIRPEWPVEAADVSEVKKIYFGDGSGRLPKKRDSSRRVRAMAERFLAAQADRFAGANRFKNIGLLRSE